MFNAGNHVPEMPLFEVVGNAAKVSPVQIAATVVNVGVIGVSQVVILKTKSTPVWKPEPSAAFPSA